eukprot:TRINITY_DN1993_c0_g1_i3.p1 TRINITY_DN1993_c0_g1~~TRINITY_DN1993_c0_g1_i3.p1  ORF type:complete len:238 (+),score=29.64 TRINITY_DN1993_c0_g1_i3:185-898(+)
MLVFALKSTYYCLMAMEGRESKLEIFVMFLFKNWLKKLILYGLHDHGFILGHHPDEMFQLFILHCLVFLVLLPYHKMITGDKKTYETWYEYVVLGFMVSEIVAMQHLIKAQMALKADEREIASQAFLYFFLNPLLDVIITYKRGYFDSVKKFMKMTAFASAIAGFYHLIDNVGASLYLAKKGEVRVLRIGTAIICCLFAYYMQHMKFHHYHTHKVYADNKKVKVHQYRLWSKAQSHS